MCKRKLFIFVQSQIRKKNASNTIHSHNSIPYTNIMAPVKKAEKRGAHLRVPDDLKKAKKEYVPTGKSRGRAKGQKNKKVVHEKTRESIPRGSKE